MMYDQNAWTDRNVLNPIISPDLINNLVSSENQSNMIKIDVLCDNEDENEEAGMVLLSTVTIPTDNGEVEQDQIHLAHENIDIGDIVATNTNQQAEVFDIPVVRNATVPKSKRTTKVKRASSSKHSKLFKCQLCSYASKWNYSVKRHMLTHTGERPHGCNHCSKRYKDSRQLKNHLKVHENEDDTEADGHHCGKRRCHICK